MTFEELNVQQVQTLYLDNLVKQVKTGEIILREPMGATYLQDKNAQFLQNNMQKNIKTNRLAIAKNW